MSNQKNLTQSEIDDLIVKIKEEQVEAEAKRKLQAKNQAFDHFVNSGEIVSESELFDKFASIDQIMKTMATPQPVNDLHIIDYPHMLNPSQKPVSPETVAIFKKLFQEFNKKYNEKL